MKYLKTYSVLILYLIAIGSSLCQDSQQASPVIDSLYTASLINHLRNNFDDIHDVSMRFHHKDHTLNGLIVLGLHWENGRLTSHSIERNDTKDEDFAVSLIEKIKKWYIKDMINPFKISLPLNIQIVGNTDSTFAEKCILTGKIIDEADNPVKGVKLSFVSTSNKENTLRGTYTNREGIFVKTLIPAGNWNVVFEDERFDRVVLENVNFRKGEHKRKNVTMHISQ